MTDTAVIATQSARLWANHMPWRVLLMSLPLMTAGCAVLDPAPFNPAGESGIVPSFTSYKVAADQLQNLAKNYSSERDQVMRQKLGLDLPLLGLGVAAAANGIFHGAQTATLALGLGSAGVGGASLYFAPQTKITAYTAAQQGLFCARSVAEKMDAEDTAEAPPGSSTADYKEELANDIAQATDELTSEATTASKDLLAARDAATKALTDVTAADALRASGVGQLESFATDVINVATTKVVTGAQNIAAAQAALGKSAAAPAMPTAAATTSAVSKPVPSPLEKLSRATVQTKAQIIQNLIADLKADAAAASVVTQRVNTAWSGFAKCSSS